MLSITTTDQNFIVQPVSQNYFQIFELPQAFAVDVDALSEKYRQLQSEHHPDRFAGAEEGERLQAVQLTSLINEAYETLKIPMKRAAYLLSLSGIDTERVDQADLGMDLLMEQMQLRESLAELPADESALPELESLKKEVTEKMQERQTHFAQLIASNEVDAARKLFHEMQFLHKLIAEIDQGEEQRLGY